MDAPRAPRALPAGLLLPWSRPVYGYLLDLERPRDPHGVRICEAQAAVVRQIFAWYLEEGASLSSIVNRLFEHGVISPTGKPRWRHTTVRFLLRNPAYTGTLDACRSRARRSVVRRSALQPNGRRHNDSAAGRLREEWVAAGSIPALVTQEQYEMAQEKLQRNRQFAARNNKAHDYLLRALAVRPRGIILAGDSRRFTLPKEQDDFRLLSQGIKNVTFVTYDELLTRLQFEKYSIRGAEA